MEKIVWRHGARYSFNAIYEWYIENLGLRAATKFYDGILHNVELIASNKKIGKVFESEVVQLKAQYRVLVVHKSNSIVYAEQTDGVVAIAYILSSKIQPRRSMF